MKNHFFLCQKSYNQKRFLLISENETELYPHGLFCSNNKALKHIATSD